MEGLGPCTQHAQAHAANEAYHAEDRTQMPADRNGRSRSSSGRQCSSSSTRKDKVAQNIKHNETIKYGLIGYNDY